MAQAFIPEEYVMGSPRMLFGNTVSTGSAASEGGADDGSAEPTWQVRDRGLFYLIVVVVVFVFGFV